MFFLFPRPTRDGVIFGLKMAIFDTFLKKFWPNRKNGFQKITTPVKAFYISKVVHFGVKNRHSAFCHFSGKVCHGLVKIRTFQKKFNRVIVSL